MIVPNLVVTDIGRSVSFYRDVLGFEVRGVVTSDRGFLTDGSTDDGVFAQLGWEGGELMLQLASSLADDVGTEAGPPGWVSATVYLRGFDHRDVDVPADVVVTGPERSWYGMNELYVRDPDGHVLCLGFPEGPPPGV